MLLVVVAMLLAASGSMTEKALLQRLSEVGLHPEAGGAGARGRRAEAVRHPVLGNIRVFVTKTAVERGYLLRKRADLTKAQGGGGTAAPAADGLPAAPQFNLSLGRRALMEFPYQDVLRFMASVYGEAGVAADIEKFWRKRVEALDEQEGHLGKIGSI